MPTVISDASPLVHLSAIGRFDLLRDLYPDLLIPQTVWNEVTVEGAGRIGAAELTAAAAAGWIRLQAPTAANLARNELKSLDEGEAEALALALDLQAEIILIDDLRGRNVAHRLGLRVIGTLGILIEAKVRGLLNAVRPELINLRRKSKLQLSHSVEQLALRLAGEDSDA